MRKTTAKLISVTLMMVLSLCLMTVSSYAYLVLSHNPAVSGIAFPIAGKFSGQIRNRQSQFQNGGIFGFADLFL